MQYFKLTIDPGFAREIPQNISFLKNYDNNHPDSLRNAKNKMPIGKLVLPPFIELKPKAEWTDILSIIEIGVPLIVVSQPLLEVINEVVAPPIVEAFPVTVKKKQQTNPYFVVSIGPGKPEFIDFSRSPAILEDISTQTEKTFILNSAEEFLQQRLIIQPPQYFVIRKPVLNIKAITCDIFRLGFGTGAPDYFVSEKLVEKCVKANLKGIFFRPLDETEFTPA